MNMITDLYNTASSLRDIDEFPESKEKREIIIKLCDLMKDQLEMIKDRVESELLKM